MDEDPTTAVAAPAQLVVRLLGLATISVPGAAVGNVSVNATPVSVRLALVLLSVNVRLVVPLSGIVAAPKAFRMVGGLMTVRVSVAALVALPASLESRVTLLLKTDRKSTRLNSS